MVPGVGWVGAGGGDSGGGGRGRSRAAQTGLVDKTVQTGHEAIQVGNEYMQTTFARVAFHIWMLSMRVSSCTDRA